MALIAVLGIRKGLVDHEKQLAEIKNYLSDTGKKIDCVSVIDISKIPDVDQMIFSDIIDNIRENDTIIISSLAKIGKTVGEVTENIVSLLESEAGLIICNLNIRLPEDNIKPLDFFNIIASLEKELIGERTKLASASIEASGVKPGRPKGKLGTSQLSGMEGEIKDMLDNKVSKSAIARLLSVSRTTLHDFIKTRGLE